MKSITSIRYLRSVCTEHFNNSSDVDLLVSFRLMDFGSYADNYFQAVDAFEKVFCRPVDLVTDKSLRNPYFIRSVNQTKTRLYGREY